jgi:predicted Kef-type K+ transport protein
MTDESADAKARAIMQDRLQVRAGLKEEHDRTFKIAGYILAGHAAGTIACISVLKDYKTTPELKGIGVFIVIFGLGLITSCLAYVCLSHFTKEQYRYIMGYSTEQKDLEQALFGFNLMAFASMVLLLIAVGLVMWKFYAL